jgi:hypothetical protein
MYVLGYVFRVDAQFSVCLAGGYGSKVFAVFNVHYGNVA